MKAFPIISTPVMLLLCLVLLFFTIKITKKKTYIIVIILLFLINQRYMIPTGTTNTIANNIDVLFVIDNTLSMNAEDYNGQEKRLDGVKKDCQEIINELNGSRFSLITFANEAKVMTPFTRDTSMAYDAIDIIQPTTELYAKGTSLNKPIEIMESSLKASYNKDPDKVRIVIFISDGEITDNSKLKSYASIKKYVTNGMVLGYGTRIGGHMKYKDPYSTSESYVMYYDNTKYDKATSVINEDNLKAIANDIGVPYIHMKKQENMKAQLNKIKSLMSSEMTSTNNSSYEDIYYIFVFPLLLLIVIDFYKMRRHII